MPEFPREVEIERIMNLVRNFGWEKISETQENDAIILTLKKKYEIETPGRTDAIPT